MTGLVLYGAPAVGKDTITEALEQLGETYERYQVLKAGTGRSTGYRMTTVDHLTALEAAGQLVVSWSRYGNRYGIDRPSLEGAVTARTPIVHLADPKHVERLERQVPGRWIVVELVCPRDVAEARLRLRNPDDVLERLAVFDAVPHLWPAAALRLDTSTVEPVEAAELIDSYQRLSLT